MKKRRIVFSFSLKAESTKDQLKKIPDMINNIFEKIEDTELDICFLKEIS